MAACVSRTANESKTLTVTQEKNNQRRSLVRSQFPLFLCIIKMAAARFHDAERISEERHVFKVFKEPEITKEEDTEQFCGRKILLCLDVN